jgi:DNA-binding transcriptional LysR family regulator
VSLRLLEFRHQHLLEEAVRGGAGDVAVGPRPASWAGPVVRLGLERFVLVLSKNDPAAARVKPYPQGPPPAALQSLGTLSLAHLSEHSWITFDREHGLSELIHGHLTRSMLNPNYVMRTMQVDAAARVAASGVGVALLPANAVHRDIEGLVVEPDPPLTRQLAIYARLPFGPTVTGYVDILRQVTTMIERPERR